MREILFRGMTLSGEIFIGNSLIQEDETVWIRDENTTLEVKPETVSQYTGYKMKGVQVFFGDLVSNNYKTDKEVIREILLYKGQMMMKLVKGKSRLGKYILLDDMCNLNYEIIGNIWEVGE